MFHLKLVRFYAWVGFTTLVLGVPYVAYRLFVWHRESIAFLRAAGYDL